MEFVKSVLKVKIYGESHEVRFPTLFEVKKFSKSKKEPIENMVEFLERLGLSKETSESMEVGHLRAIIEAVCAEKKS